MSTDNQQPEEQPADDEQAEELVGALELPGAAAVPLDVRDIDLEEIAELDNIRPGHHDIPHLAETMHLEGQLQPCRVRPAPAGATHGKPYELIFGFRRKRAAEYLASQGIEGWETLRCEVVEVPDDEKIAQMVVENFQREDMSPIAEARAMYALKHSTDPELANGEIARQLGCDPSHVSHRLTLLKLGLPPAPAQKALDAVNEAGPEESSSEDRAPGADEVSDAAAEAAARRVSSIRRRPMTSRPSASASPPRNPLTSSAWSIEAKSQPQQPR